MKWPWAVILAASTLLGCRSAQQPTNPFLRTTVPPPGTGEAAVVVPGQPYYPGATSPPSPQLAPAPVVPVVPVAAPPPVISPRDQKKTPPGGNYFYHQSSVDRSRDVDPDGSQPAQAFGDAAEDVSNLAVNAADPGALRLGGKSDAVKQAVALANEPNPVDAASFESYGGLLPGETALEEATTSARQRPVAHTETHFGPEGGVRSLGSGSRASDDPLDEYDSSSMSRASLHIALG